MRFPGIYHQRGPTKEEEKKMFKQPNKPKSLKWQAFQRGSNLVRANPAGRLKGVHFGRGRGLDADARQDINPAEKTLGKSLSSTTSAKDKSPSTETRQVEELLQYAPCLII